MKLKDAEDFFLVCLFLSLDNIIKRELLASKIVSSLFDFQYNIIIVLIIISAMVIYIRKLSAEQYLYLYKV